MGNSQQKLCDRSSNEETGSRWAGPRFPAGIFESDDPSDSEQEIDEITPETVTSIPPRSNFLTSTLEFARPSSLPFNNVSSTNQDNICENHDEVSPFVDESPSQDLSCLPLHDAESESISALANSTVSGTLRALYHTISRLHLRSQQHVEAMEELRDLVLEGEDVRERIATEMLTIGFPEICMQLARAYLSRDRSDFDDVEEEKNKWKILEILYHILVKITDKSASFCRSLTEAGLLQCTTKTLASEDHKNKCVSEIYTGATLWMLELVGNCYDDLPRGSSMRDVCKHTVSSYLEIGSDAIKMKAGQTMLMIVLKDRVEERLQQTENQQHVSTTSDAAAMATYTPRSEEVAEVLVQEFLRGLNSVASGGETELLEGLMEEVSPERRRAREAEHLCEIGMPRVFCENIRRWLKDSSRWLAFNENGKMWRCVQEWFAKIASLSRASDVFCLAVCEGGVIPHLQEVITNEQIQEAHLRNNKVKEIVACAISTLLSATKLKTSAKWYNGIQVKEALKYYVKSKDINIRGLALLALANLTPRHSTEDVGLDFTTEDIDLLLATYMAYKSEGEPLGTFLAKTNFPELCVQEFRSHVTDTEVFQDETWERVHRLMAALHLFSDKSTEFAESLCKCDIIGPLKIGISSDRFRLRYEEENTRRLLQVCLNLVHHCVRLDYKDLFLLPGFWQSMFYFATQLEPESPHRWAAFLSFAHMYQYVCKLQSEANTPSDGHFDVGQYPTLKEKHEDIKFLNKLWHTTNDEEEKILGDYIAATGGATVHARLLGQIVNDLDHLMEDETVEKLKPLLANMNNLAIESEKFAHQLCSSGILSSLKAILMWEEFDLVCLTSQEDIVIDHSLSVIAACAKYSINMQHFSEASLVDCLGGFMANDCIEPNLKKQAWSAMIHIHHNDRAQVLHGTSKLKVHMTDTQQQRFYYKLYQTGRADKVQNMIADFLVDLKVPDVMALKIKELTEEARFLEDWELTKYLLHNMWNYTDVSEPFTIVFRQKGVFEVLQDLLRNTQLREKLNTDEKCLDIIKASINILFNCSQFDSNRAALKSLRLINDLLQFSKVDIDNQHIKTSAILTIAFLVDEENAHLIRADSNSGVIRFILDKLENTVFSVDHRAGGFSTVELLRSTCRIAMNDANKIILVYDGLLTLLTKLLQDSGREEKLWSAKILWMCSFMEDNKHAIKENYHLTEALKLLVNGEDGELSRIARGAMFELDKTSDRVNRALERQVHSPARQSREHRAKFDVYLSYHDDHSDFFLQLQDALQAEGLKISTPARLSDYNIHMSAECIEKSRIFIIELSHVYQHSEYCRTEAEYARDLLKPVVPLRLERPLKPSSWLSRMIAGRVYVDFAQNQGGNDFLDHVEEVVREIHIILRNLHYKEQVE